MGASQVFVGKLRYLVLFLLFFLSLCFFIFLAVLVEKLAKWCSERGCDSPCSGRKRHLQSKKGVTNGEKGDVEMGVTEKEKINSDGSDDEAQSLGSGTSSGDRRRERAKLSMAPPPSFPKRDGLRAPTQRERRIVSAKMKLLSELLDADVSGLNDAKQCTEESMIPSIVEVLAEVEGLLTQATLAKQQGAGSTKKIRDECASEYELLQMKAEVVSLAAKIDARVLALLADHENLLEELHSRDFSVDLSRYRSEPLYRAAILALKEGVSRFGLVNVRAALLNSMQKKLGSTTLKPHVDKDPKRGDRSDSCAVHGRRDVKREVGEEDCESMDIGGEESTEKEPAALWGKEDLVREEEILDSFPERFRCDRQGALGALSSLPVSEFWLRPHLTVEFYQYSSGSKVSSLFASTIVSQTRRAIRDSGDGLAQATPEDQTEAVRRLEGPADRSKLLMTLPTRTAAAILVELKLRGDYAMVLEMMPKAAREALWVEVSRGASIDAPNNPRRGGIGSKGSGSFNLVSFSMSTFGSSVAPQKSNFQDSPAAGNATRLFSSWRRGSVPGRMFAGSKSRNEFCPGLPLQIAPKLLACGSAVEAGMLLRSMPVKQSSALLLEIERRGAAGPILNYLGRTMPSGVAALISELPRRADDWNSPEVYKCPKGLMGAGRLSGEDNFDSEDDYDDDDTRTETTADASVAEDLKMSKKRRITVPKRGLRARLIICMESMPQGKVIKCLPAVDQIEALACVVGPMINGRELVDGQNHQYDQDFAVSLDLCEIDESEERKELKVAVEQLIASKREAWLTERKKRRKQREEDCKRRTKPRQVRSVENRYEQLSSSSRERKGDKSEVCALRLNGCNAALYEEAEAARKPSYIGDEVVEESLRSDFQTLYKASGKQTGRRSSTSSLLHGLPSEILEVDHKDNTTKSANTKSNADVVRTPVKSELAALLEEFSVGACYSAVAALCHGKERFADVAQIGAANLRKAGLPKAAAKKVHAMARQQAKMQKDIENEQAALAVEALTAAVAPPMSATIPEDSDGHLSALQVGSHNENDDSESDMSSVSRRLDLSAAECSLKSQPSSHETSVESGERKATFRRQESLDMPNESYFVELSNDDGEKALAQSYKYAKETTTPSRGPRPRRPSQDATLEQKGVNEKKTNGREKYNTADNVLHRAQQRKDGEAAKVPPVTPEMYELQQKLEMIGEQRAAVENALFDRNGNEMNVMHDEKQEAIARPRKGGGGSFKGQTRGGGLRQGRGNGRGRGRGRREDGRGGGMRGRELHPRPSNRRSTARYKEISQEGDDDNDDNGTMLQESAAEDAEERAIRLKIEQQEREWAQAAVEEKKRKEAEKQDQSQRPQDTDTLAKERELEKKWAAEAAAAAKVKEELRKAEERKKKVGGNASEEDLKELERYQAAQKANKLAKDRKQVEQKTEDDNNRAVVNCAEGHGLKRFRTPEPGWYCSKCRQLFEGGSAEDYEAFDRGTIMYGCRECDFDVCVVCFQGR